MWYDSSNVVEEADVQSVRRFDILSLPMTLGTHHVETSGRDTTLLYSVARCRSHL